MPESTINTDISAITLEACAWYAQLETGELSPADQDAFREWINRSPRHAAEIKKQWNLSLELNVLSGMSQSINDAIAEHQTINQRNKYQNIFSFGKAVAVLVVAALALALFMTPVGTPNKTLYYTTKIGEQQTIELTDGSLVELNTNSQIEVSFEKNNRRVRLLKGEAFFDVTPDQERPFWVYANDQHVRVVGTAFMMSLIDSDLNLLVTEGRVELAKTPSSKLLKTTTDYQQSVTQLFDEELPEEAIALTAGQSIVVSDSNQKLEVIKISEREQLRELSWQDGLHDFSNTRLEDVIKELSRYTSMNIEINNAELRDLKFGGVFRIGEIEPLFDALESAYGLKVSHLNDNTIQLSLAN